MGEIIIPGHLSEPWQNTTTNNGDKWLHVWQNDLFTDITFKVGYPETTFSCHKIVLVIHSPVFETMFGQRWSQSASASADRNSKPEISLPEEDPEIFKLLLEFSYTGRLSTDETEKLVAVLMLAKKYLCNSLIKKCIDVLKDSLSVVNVMQIYQVGEMLDEADLHRATEEYILHNANSLFTSGEITKIKKTDLCKLLRNDELNVAEIDLFNAVYSWARSECRRLEMEEDDPSALSEILHDIIPLIRFTNMSAEDFSLHVVPKNILSMEDTVKIFRFMTTPQEKREEVKPDLDLQFNTTKRSLSYFVYNLRRLKGHGFDFGTKWQNFSFETDRDVRIISLGFYRPIEPDLPVEVGMKILSHDLTETYAEIMEPSARCFAGDIFHIKFKTPVKIAKEVLYTISYIVKGKETFYKTVGESTITANCGAEGRVTFKFKEAVQDTDFDQVPEICFRL